MTACGKRGAPLPPLVRVPAAPADFTVERRGEDVTLQFKVPAANTDGSRPANIERIDVYAFSGPATVNDEQLVKFGTKVASLPVKAPRNPDAATESDEPPEEPDLEAEGLDQGAVATLEDPLTPAAFQAVVLPEDKKGRSQAGPEAARPPGGPLVGPPPGVDSRIYVLVPLNKRGRKGSLSPRMLIPLVPKPETPATPAIAYDEAGINVSWPPPPAAAQIQPPATGDLLPGRYIGMETSSYAYHVYDVSPPAASDAGTTTTPQLAKEVRLTGEAVAEPLFHDTRMDWGADALLHGAHLRDHRRAHAAERCAGAGVRHAGGHLPAGSAEGAPDRRQRGCDRPHLGTERGKRRHRIRRAPRHDAGGQARGDQAAERRGNDVHRYRQGGRAVRVRGAGDRQGGQHQPDVESQGGCGTVATGDDSSYNPDSSIRHFRSST